MNATDKLSPKPRLPGRRFVKRMYLMRLLGTFLCFIPVLSVLVEHHRSVWLMILLGANAFIWPTVAWLRARRSPTPWRPSISTWCWMQAPGVLDRDDGG